MRDRGSAEVAIPPWATEWATRARVERLAVLIGEKVHCQRRRVRGSSIASRSVRDQLTGWSEPTPIATGLAAGSRPLSGRLRVPSPGSRLASLVGAETSSKVLTNPLFRADSLAEVHEHAGRVSVLLPEVRAPEPPGLRGRESWCDERVHDFVGELPLIGRKARWIGPAQSSAEMLSCTLVFERVSSSVRRCSSRTCSRSVWNTSYRPPRAINTIGRRSRPRRARPRTAAAARTPRRSSSRR